MDNKTIDLLKLSITDMQMTIRSTDIKSGLLMTALVIPLANVKDLSYFYALLKALADNYPRLCGYWFPSSIIVLSCLCFLIWLFAVFSILHVIYPFTQNIAAIESETHSLDCFFLGGITIQESASTLAAIQQAHKNLPRTNEHLISVLLFEQVKLARLRACKLRGLKISILSVSLFIFSALVTVFGYFLFTSIN